MHLALKREEMLTGLMLISGIVQMKPVIEKKRTAHLTYKENPCPETLSALRAANKESKQTARQCANNFWRDFCDNMQHNLALGNSKALHDGIKTALGPEMSKPAPILSKSGEKITDQTKQLER